MQIEKQRQYRELERLTSECQKVAIKFIREMELGGADAAVRSIDPSIDAAVYRPSLLAVAGRARFDAALRQSFNEGLESRELPMLAPKYGRFVSRFEGEVTCELDDGTAMIRITGKDGDLHVDPTPYMDPSLTLDDATAMHAELMALADRVEAGEFATYDDALAAYEQTAAGRHVAERATTQPAE